MATSKIRMTWSIGYNEVISEVIASCDDGPSGAASTVNHQGEVNIQLVGYQKAYFVSNMNN